VPFALPLRAKAALRPFYFAPHKNVVSASKAMNNKEKQK
jgi:hypothetical protein